MRVVNEYLERVHDTIMSLNWSIQNHTQYVGGPIIEQKELDKLTILRAGLRKAYQDTLGDALHPSEVR